MNLKPENLKEPAVKPGDAVEVPLMSGQRGLVLKYFEETEQFQVCFDPEKPVNLMPKNLARPPLAPVDLVEVIGLESESGKSLNGQKCVVTKYVAEADRFQVRLESEELKNLKLENLQRPELGPGDTVVVSGLESESGKLLNGERGHIVRYEETTGRFEVRFRLVNFKPSNLKKVALQFNPGDTVEVSGLSEVDGGKLLNGKRGRVTSYIKGSGMFQVCLGPKKQMNLRPDNLKKIADSLTSGDQVEVHGLESESGRQMNGKQGVIMEYIKETSRFEVLFMPEKLVRLKPENLRKISEEESMKCEPDMPA